MSDDNIRIPDNIINERLIDDYDYNNSDNNNNDLEEAIKKSIEEYNIEDDNIQLEEIINLSIIEKIEEYEKRKNEKKDNLKLLLSRIGYIIKDKNILQSLLNIFDKYINNMELYTYISQNEYDLFISFMDYIYTIPNYKNIRSIIKKDDYEKLVKYIVTNENGLNEDELYIISTNWITDYSQNEINSKIIEINKRFN